MKNNMVRYGDYEIYDKIKISRSANTNASAVVGYGNWSILLDFYIIDNSSSTIIGSRKEGWSLGEFKISYDNNILTIQESENDEDKYVINNIDFNKRIRLYYSYDYDLGSSILKVNNTIYQHSLENKNHTYYQIYIGRAIYKYIVINSDNNEEEWIPAKSYSSSGDLGFIINNNSFKTAVTDSRYVEVLDADDQEKLEEIIDGSVRVLYNEGVGSLRQDVLKNQYNLKFVNLPQCINVGYDVFANCNHLRLLNLSNCTSILGGTGIFRNCRDLDIFLGYTNNELPPFYVTNNINLYFPNLITLNLSAGTVVASNNLNIYLPNITINANLHDSSGEMAHFKNIYVPEQLYNNYINDPSWSNYTDKIMNIPNTTI